MKNGFIRLSRKFFRSEYWLQERTYSKAEAWIDLIMQARFEAAPAIKVLPNGKELEIKRGEVHASLRFLAKRWGWGVTAVRLFLEKLKQKQMITHQTTQGESVISLVNYSRYNPNKRSNKTVSNTLTTHRQHTGNTKNKKEKKVKKEKNGGIAREPEKNLFDSVSDTFQPMQPIQPIPPIPPIPQQTAELRYDADSVELLNHVIEQWNKISHVQPFQCQIVPEFTRFEFLKRFQEFGKEGLFEALNQVEKSEYYKTKAVIKPDFNKFLEPKTFNAFLAGRYEKNYESNNNPPKKQHEPTGFNPTNNQEYSDADDEFVRKNGI